MAPATLFDASLLTPEPLFQAALFFVKIKIYVILSILHGAAGGLLDYVNREAFIIKGDITMCHSVTR